MMESERGDDEVVVLSFGRRMREMEMKMNEDKTEILTVERMG